MFKIFFMVVKLVLFLFIFFYRTRTLIMIRHDMFDQNRILLFQSIGKYTKANLWNKCGVQCTHMILLCIYGPKYI